MGLHSSQHSLQPPVLSDAFRNLGAGPVVAVERERNVLVKLRPIFSDFGSVALLAEEQHLSVPIVRSERPAVTEHYGLALSPVLVVNMCAVFCCDSRHVIFSFLQYFVLQNPYETTMCSDQAVRTRSGRMALCHAFTDEPDTALRIHPRSSLWLPVPISKRNTAWHKSRCRVSSSRSDAMSRVSFRIVRDPPGTT